MLKGQKSEINDFMKQEDREVRLKVKSEIKDMLCLGRANKVAKGPNPKSILKKKKTHTEESVPVLGEKRKRRIRKGKRSREISLDKKRAKLDNTAL